MSHTVSASSQREYTSCAWPPPSRPMSNPRERRRGPSHPFVLFDRDVEAPDLAVFPRRRGDEHDLVSARIYVEHRAPRAKDLEGRRRVGPTPADDAAGDKRWRSTRPTSPVATPARTSHDGRPPPPPPSTSTRPLAWTLASRPSDPLPPTVTHSSKSLSTSCVHVHSSVAPAASVSGPARVPPALSRAMTSDSDEPPRCACAAAT